MESGPTSEGKQSGLWAFLSRVYSSDAVVSRKSPHSCFRWQPETDLPPRGTSTALRCESNGFPSILPRRVYKLWCDYIKMRWYHQTSRQCTSVLVDNLRRQLFIIKGNVQRGWKWVSDAHWTHTSATLSEVISDGVLGPAPSCLHRVWFNLSAIFPSTELGKVSRGQHCASWFSAIFHTQEVYCLSLCLLLRQEAITGKVKHTSEWKWLSHHLHMALNLEFMCAQSCPTLWPYGLQPTRLLCLWNFPGKNTGVGFHYLLQGIFLTQGSNLRLLHWWAESLSLSHLGSPINHESRV